MCVDFLRHPLKAVTLYSSVSPGHQKHLASRELHPALSLPTPTPTNLPLTPLQTGLWLQYSASCCQIRWELFWPFYFLTSQQPFAQLTTLFFLKLTSLNCANPRTLHYRSEGGCGGDRFKELRNPALLGFKFCLSLGGSFSVNTVQRLAWGDGLPFPAICVHPLYYLHQGWKILGKYVPSLVPTPVADIIN